MYWATSLVLVCLMVTWIRCEHGRYGFVERELIETQCILNPLNNVCPLDHKVPNTYRLSSLMRVLIRKLNNTLDVLRSAGGDEICFKAFKLFECSKEFYTCKENLSYYYFDSVKVYRLCMNARQACSAEVDEDTLDKSLDCNSFQNASLKRYNRRNITCEEHPKWENDTCPMRNYKVPSYVNFKLFVQGQKTVQSLLTENNVGKNCTDKIFAAFCDLDTPACTRDEKYVVSLLGRQKCHEIIACLNATNNRTLTTLAENLCNQKPDEDTVKKIPISNITNPTTTPAPNNTTKEILVACCKASRLSTIGLLFMVFTVWLFFNSFSQ